MVASVAALLALAGCGDVVVVQHGTRPDATLAPGLPSLQPPASAFAGLSPPPAAAVIAGLDVLGPQGTPIPLASLRGARGTVVAFWASYCTPCVKELPALQRLAPALSRQGVALLLVDYREDASTAASFLRAHDVSLTAWMDRDGSVHDHLGLLGVPTTAVLTADGSVGDRLEGAEDTSNLGAVLGAMGVSTQ